MKLICSKCRFEKDESLFYKNKRYVSGYMTWCKECHYNYYHKNPENKAKLKSAIKRWSVNNAEYIQEYAKQYHIDNLEHEQDRNNRTSRERWASDPEYRKRKNDFKKLDNQKRRAIVRTTGELTVEQWNNICNKYMGICLRCRRIRKLTVDHIIPLSRGGTHTEDNVQPLCANCNSKKATVAIDYRYNWR